MNFSKQRIHNALNASLRSGDFYRCSIDPNTGSMSISATTVSPTSIEIKEVRTSYREAKLYKRESGATELEAWMWIGKLSFNCEVAFEFFEEMASERGIRIPPIQGATNQRTLIAYLKDSIYSHPPEQSPTNGTVVEFLFQISPELLRR